MATAKKVFRLRDILTKEVSIVDRAANLRVFLVTKRAAEGKPLERDAQGRLVTKSEGEPAPADPPKEETPPADPPKEAPPAPEPKDPSADPPAEPPKKEEPPPGDPPKVESTDAVKMTEETYKGLVASIEKLTALASRAKRENVTADEDAVEPAVIAAISDLGTVREREVPPMWADNVWKCSSTALEKQLKAASQKLLEVAESLAVKTSDDPPPIEVRWRITDVLDALVELTRFEPAEAALAKQDAERFRELAASLQKSLSVHTESPAPDAGVDLEHASKLLVAAEGVITALREEVVAKGKRIDELESAPGLSHSIPVEQSEPSARQRATGWPLDMNQKKYDDDLSFA